MSGVKIQLSREEQEMAANTGIILTKNRILTAVQELFGELSTAEIAHTEAFRTRLPAEVYSLAPKISRGENYQQMPWLMLDYPRHFEKAETLAIRQFFWWGNFFSVNLQVSGKFKEALLGKISAWPGNTYICVQPSPWEHHFGADNFKPVAGLEEAEIKEIATASDYLKLSAALPLTQWEDAQTFLLNGFNNYLELFLD